MSSEILPLEEALQINGLRAIFGEVYPDPVRVLCVGPSMDTIKKNPRDDKWMEYSIEFCGGTHLNCTGDAAAFAILGEWL